MSHWLPRPGIIVLARNPTPSNGGGAGGVGGGGWGVVVRILLVVLCLLCASCILYEMYTLEITLDVLYAPTTNGGTGIAGPQQTNGNPLIILYLICSYAKRNIIE